MGILEKMRLDGKESLCHRRRSGHRQGHRPGADRGGRTMWPSWISIRPRRSAPPSADPGQRPAGHRDQADVTDPDQVEAMVAQIVRSLVGWILPSATRASASTPPPRR